MSDPILVPLPGNDDLARGLGHALGMEIGGLEVRKFPDGETYLRYTDQIERRTVILLCTLDRPDEKFLPLVFAAATARSLKASRVGLVAPYLAYMRQDQRFKPRESITSVHFARLLSEHIDWLITVDPHLHRRSSLEEIYAVPAIATGAAPLIAGWLGRQVKQPVLIGPDEESEQWVASVAGQANAPYTVLRKIRRGDHDVEISLPDNDLCRNGTPVLVDDMVSTGRTMIETIGLLSGINTRPPICVGVHGVFAGTAYLDLLAAGAAQVVTTNTIPHESNQIDATGLLAEAIRDLTS